MREYHLLLTVILIAAQAGAQPVDTLVRESLSNHPQVRSFEHLIQASGFRAASSGSWPAPSVGIELSQIPTNSANVFNDAMSNNISLSQMFMLGGKLTAMSDVEKKKGRVLEENLRSLQVQLRARVKMNYFQLWLLDRRIEVQRRTAELLHDLAELLKSQVVTNRSRQADLYSVQAEVVSAEVKLSELRSQRAGMQNALNVLLGRGDLGRRINTDGDLPRPQLSVSVSELSEKVGELNPSLVAMDRMREMNDAEIVAAKKDLIPDVMLQVMMMRMPNGMILTGGPRSTAMIQQSAAGMAMAKTEWMYSVMASFTLPFAPWSSVRSSARVEEVRSTNLSIELEKSAMRREMIASLQSAVTKYATSDSLVRRYEAEILPLARQSAEAQTAAYQTGLVPITTVLDSRRMELMRREDYLMTLVDRQMAFTDIEMMAGISLQ